MRAGEVAAQKAKGGLLAQPALEFDLPMSAQSVQRRSARSLIWRSEAAVKVGCGLLTIL